MIWFHLAQDMPDSELLHGSAQDVLAWVVLAQIALYVVTCAYFIYRQRWLEDKLDSNFKDTLKLALRSQRAVETLAHLPPMDDE